MCGVMFVLIFAFLCLPDPSCTNSDNMALLLGTLKMMQRASCDDEMVSLSCPRGTAISIQVAQYGKAANGGHNCVAQTNSQGVAVEVIGEKECLWPNNMQYSLLQTVVEACQKKPQCKFSTKPKPGLTDPCPMTRKFVEVAYKCRPLTFRSRTSCEDDVIQLNCNPHSRITIFDARYGRTAYESITCPQTQGVKDENVCDRHHCCFCCRDRLCTCPPSETDETCIRLYCSGAGRCGRICHTQTCTAPHGTDTVMQICHGKRRCIIEANSKTFGTPCKTRSRAYLKVIYACVPLGVLTEKYESAAESDEILNSSSRSDSDDQNFFEDTEGASERWGETNAVPALVNPSMQPPSETFTSPSSTENDHNTILDPNNADNGRNSESSDYKIKLLIYVSSGILIFIILILLLIAVRCYIIRKTSDDSKTGDMFSTEAPNVFNDAVSDIDNDIDVSHISGTFYDPTHPDMILYRDVPGNKGTIRAMKPLSTIYPCAGASMYGNVDYVPSHSREVSTTRFKDKEEDDPAMLSPRSLGAYSNSQFYYG